MAKPISSRTAILAALAAMPGLVHSTPAPVGQEAQAAVLDSIEQNLDPVEAQARRSLFGGGSKPVSFSGEAMMRFIGTSYDKYPSWMTQDVTETKNTSASIRLAMVGAPHRNIRIWSKIAFNSQMLGNNKPANSPYVSDKALFGTPRMGSLDLRDNTVYEDMCAGLIAKTGPVTTQSRIGGVLWTEASPLSVWKGQNRMFGWDYVPYELEQSNAQYYEYATIKGEKTGRAAWNKKAFQGLQFESIEMPWNLYYNVTYGSFDMGQKYQPFMINTNTTNGLMSTNEYPSGTEVPGPRKYGDKGNGIGDTYRKTLLLRLAKAELPLGITGGLNYVNYKTDNDYPRQYWNLWSGTGDADYRPVAAWYYRDSNDVIGKYSSNYFVNSQVVSADFRRNLPGGLQFHFDIGASSVDTTYFMVEDRDSAIVNWRRFGVSDSATIVNATKGQVLGHGKQEWTPAIYGMVAYPVSVVGKNIDLQLQSIFAPKKFYSGSSFILPLDAMFPYESNLTGAGKFAGADNGTPYTSNLLGANLTTKLPVANGHAKINFGFHTQIDKGSDFIFLPWRLNGTAYNYTLNASSSRYDGATLTDAYLMGNYPATTAKVTSGGPDYDGTNLEGRYRQIRRMGNEFYWAQNPNGTERRNAYAPQPGLAGGIRNDYLATFEGFGAFRLRKDASSREIDLESVQSMFETGRMPQTKKATQNLSIDLAKDVARYWGGKNSLHLALYGALNSITKSGSPIPTLSTNDDVILNSYNIRFEPVVQITQKLYLIGLFGHETWKSSYGVAAIDSANGTAPSSHADYLNPDNWYAAPIDYSDWAYGAGIDWDIASRVGLHLRLQKFTHEDKGISKEVPTAAGKNDYEAWFFHAETKMWF